jgi:hypothetical protein
MNVITLNWQKIKSNLSAVSCQCGTSSVIPRLTAKRRIESDGISEHSRDIEEAVWTYVIK